ncbi:hypothetical protein APV28_2149 [Comamonas testosteroni]|nr:hypothetical protein APV28_2149 [Comamonas testosteroni]
MIHAPEKQGPCHTLHRHSPAMHQEVSAAASPEHHGAYLQFLCTNKVPNHNNPGFIHLQQGLAIGIALAT